MERATRHATDDRAPQLGAVAAVHALLVLLLSAALMPAHALAAECGRTSTGLIPLAALGTGTYKGAQGGLYGSGINVPPSSYATAGYRASESVVPRDAQGRPDPNGKIVLLSIGMSNTTQEFSAFVALARVDPERDPNVVVVDGAQGGQDARVWSSPDAKTWSVVEDRLRSAGVTAAQVQAIWIKQALARPTTDFASHTRELAGALETSIKIASERYPNLAQVFLSPRTYGGYASTSLNPEPYAYESAFAVREVVMRSVSEPQRRPWIGWGPYTWTDGTRPDGSELIWTCDDVRPNDGTHPSDSGRQKVAQLLQGFFRTSPFTAWYRADAVTAAPQPMGDAGSSPDPVISLEHPTLDTPSLIAAGDDSVLGWGWILSAFVVLFGGALVAIRLRH